MNVGTIMKIPLQVNNWEEDIKKVDNVMINKIMIET